MITFSSLGKKGNLGNQLFQIASTIGIATKGGHDYFFPSWEYEKYFEHQLPHLTSKENFILAKELKYKFYNWNLKEGNFDINGWLQSEKYFDEKKTRDVFKFKKSFYKSLTYEYSYLYNKKNILISVRRGDFVNHPYYYQLSYKYYFLAIIKHFPDWKDRNLIFTSDDINYCKYHFSFLENSYFLENLLPIEQIVLGSCCDDLIISNSTFSWWIAWLAEKNNKDKKVKIIRPIKNFRGEFATVSDDIDYYPSRWIAFDDKKWFFPIYYLRLFFKGEILKISIQLKHMIKLFKKKIKELLINWLNEKTGVSNS